MKTIWMLSDGLPGHFNQSIGLSKAIQSRFEHDLIRIDIRLKSKVFRSLMRFITNYLPWLIGRRLFTLFYQHNEMPLKNPSLIISAGGNTLFANIALSKVLKVNNIYSGTLKGYKSHLISKVFTVVAIKGITNNVVLDLPPANISAISGTHDQPFYTLLVGGDGAGYTFSEIDWQQLVIAISEIAQRNNIKWKITTSRRTGETVEKQLRQMLNTDLVDEVVWFSSNPQKVVKRFLAEGQVIFCTEDSLTMISEAIYAHKPVVTLQPQLMKPEENDYQALEKYQQRQFIIRTPIATLSLLDLNKDKFCNKYPDVEEQIVNAVSELWIEQER